MLYILLSALAAVSTFGTDLSCLDTRPNQYLFYCEGFEREYPPENWAFESSYDKDSWERIYWQGPDGLNPLDKCAGRYFLLSKVSGDNLTSRIEGPTFSIQPDWSDIRFSFMYSLIGDEVKNYNLKVFLVLNEIESTKIQIYPCPESIDCNSVRLSKNWRGFSLPLNSFIEGMQAFQFSFEYKSNGKSAIALDDFFVTVYDEKDSASGEYPQYVDRCDYYSGPPNAQWEKVENASDDDDGCGCGAVDSGAGGGGFFVFPFLTLCLIFLYRKRARLV